MGLDIPAHARPGLYNCRPLVSSSNIAHSILDVHIPSMDAFFDGYADTKMKAWIRPLFQISPFCLKEAGGSVAAQRINCFSPAEHTKVVHMSSLTAILGRISFKYSLKYPPRKIS